ncbi:MAG: hypothetical protein O7G31_03085 [Calditrichaeota bacterium]|nr:hypothetical protein [Calditrichota bacterium]
MQNLARFFVFAAISLMFINSCTQEEVPESASGSQFDASKSDPKAVEVIEQMWQALGKDKWDRVAYLSFRWIVEIDGQTRADFRHDWNRQDNRYRVEGTNREGQHFLAIFDTQTKLGDVYLDGEGVTVDSTKTQLLDYAYGRYINDSYWLIMPYKLKDPGVILDYDGEQEVDGKPCDIVKITFESVGLTPGDTYWAFIDKEDHLMKRWEYHLEDWPADRERSGASWQDWQDFGGVKLALNKPFLGRPGHIFFKDVKVSDMMDASTFDVTSKTF